MAAAAICLPREDELWSGSRETLEQRMEYFLGNEALADMTFLVGDDRRRIPGHKFILSSCSWDFYNALHLLRIDNDELQIQDVPYESFLDFLRYCYTGNVDLRPENAVDILKLAYRFDIKSLIKKYETEIKNIVTSDNCLQLFTQCHFLPKDSPIKIQILDVIAVNFLYIVENESMMETFTELSLKALDEIADLKAIFCEEVKIFEALMKWSTRACQKAGIDPNPWNLRKSLRRVFYKIRFPTMSSEDFVKIVGKYVTMFSGAEVMSIAKKITNTDDDTALSAFLNTNRKTEAQKITVPWPKSETRDLVPTYLITSPLITRYDNSVGLKVTSERTLLGFGVIVQRDYQVTSLPSSSDLRRKCGQCNYVKFLNGGTSYSGRNCFCSSKSELTVSSGQRHKLSYLHSLEDYYVLPIYFHVKQRLSPNVIYALEISSLLSFYGSDHNPKLPNSAAGVELFFKDNTLPIPFLYFAK